jgi:polyisoprenoid-binding protein YceI
VDAHPRGTLRPSEGPTAAPEGSSQVADTWTRDRRVTIVAVSLVAVVGVGLLLLWWFGGDVPATVSTTAAQEAIADDDGDTDDPATDEPVEDPADVPGDDERAGVVAGTWTVDRDVVAYDFAAGTGSFVGFRIDEELSTIGATTAVGRTPEVDGSVTVDGTTITVASFEADLTALVTDQPRRDGRVQSALETGTYPTATFELREPIELGEPPDAGQTVSATANGVFTLHGVSRDVEVPLDAVLADPDTLIVTGSLPVTLSDHDVTAPSAPIVVSVADSGVIEVQLYLTRR